MKVIITILSLAVVLYGQEMLEQALPSGAYKDLRK
jgi:hypothetical protein